eukprot:GHVO01015527.1.p2 GENE.GHVO01015527.1~~GHVO01015527.1.p2  ORF type:complete len:115 (-),score=5.75 GHVO01015527.1:47-391(-)
MKTKSKRSLDGPLAATSKRPCFRPVSTTSTEDITAVDGDKHREELAAQAKKTKSSQDTRHIKVLLKPTRNDQMDFLVKNPSGNVGLLFERYPCFHDSRFVSHFFNFWLLSVITI